MKRRNFVQKTAVGVIGYNLLSSGITSPHLFETAIVHQWLRQLVSATSAKRKSAFFLPAGFMEVVTSINRQFSKRGFLSKNSAFYFYNESENYCFYALELNHSNAGMTDMLLPVLHQESNGSWRHLTTINGYQLEALARAANTFVDHPDPLQHVLLPTNKLSGSKCYQGFSSQNGSIDIVTRIYGDKEAETTISISNSKEMLFNDTFVSGHCLTCSQINV